jgi:putative aldouronate transport system substrate-binding protein
MNNKRALALLSVLALTGSVAAGCGGGKDKPSGDAANETVPFPVTMAVQQVGDIPGKDNEIEQAIQKYTNTKLDIQWVPNAAYDDKINVMIASNEMPKLLKVQYVPNIINNMQAGLFWEVGPYLKEYKNLSAQNAQFYDNIQVDGKVYGVPIFSEIARAAIVYRKDWFDSLGLKVPKTTDDWYNVVKTLTLNDPDKNGKQDTYGTVLFKKYNEGQASLSTRFAVGMGGPNKWEIAKDGNVVPEFMSQEYMDVLKLYRKLYEEKLINQDFAVFDSADSDKLFDSGRVGIKIAVATTAKSQQDRLSKTDPKAVVDVVPLEGPKGIRVSGQTGNSGIFVIPKSSVKTEVELKRLLKFLDQMMDPEMAVLLMRGVENKHYVKTPDNRTEFKDFTLFQREVKPYRDNMPYIEGYNVPALKDVPVGEKGNKITQDNMKYSIPNPALTFISQTYNERGKELEQMIWDAQTKFIMGKFNETEYQGEIEKWKKSGGQKLMDEYKAEAAKRVKK